MTNQSWLVLWVGLALGLCVNAPGPQEARAAAKGTTVNLNFRELQTGVRDRLKDAELICEDSSNARIATGPSQDSARAVTLFTNAVTAPSCAFGDLAKIIYRTSDGREALCTGLFVDVKTVLTAGHCTCGDLRTYRIHKGRGDPNAANSGAVEYVLAWAPIRYANYNCQLGAEDQPGRDLALLLVETPDLFDSRTADSDPIRSYKRFDIASLHEVFADAETKRLVGVGYGRDETGSLPEKDPLYTAIPVASFFCGAGRYAESACASFREFVLADRRAASGSNPSDSCGGDSGSPIYWQAPPTPLGRSGNTAVPSLPVLLVGITSRALAGVQHNTGTTCGGGGIYTAVGHPDVINWLRSNGIEPWTAFQFSTTERAP